MDPYLWKRLWRRPWLSLFSLILCVSLSFLLMYMNSFRQVQAEKLAQIKEEYEILCVVSNRQGTKSTSLRLRHDAVLFVQDASSEGLGSYIRDLRITKEYAYSFPEQGADGAQEQLLIGVTNAQCHELLDPAMGAQVTLFEEDFYKQSGDVCLVSETLYGQLNTNTIRLYLEDPYVDHQYYGIYGNGEVEFQVGGYYKGDGNQIFISFEASQLLADQLSMGLRSFDSMSFILADNDDIQRIPELSAYIFGVVDPDATEVSWPKQALTIHDSQYRTTVAALRQNIQRASYSLPVILLVGLGVGFLISFLSTRNESRTYGLMRTLGLTRGKLFASVLREQMVLPAAAAVAAGVISMQWVPAIICLVCYGAGCAAAVFRAVRVPPTAILREQE